MFDSVNFTANTADNGGGASLFLSSIKKTMVSEKLNNITFRKCVFVNNSGNGGSALEITPSYTEQQRSQFIGRVLLIDCVFTGNFPNYQNEIGQESTLFTSQILITLRGLMKFSNNRASAILASSALLIFQENTSVEFSNNVGSKGGAIFLSGDSRMLVNDNTAFHFTNNTASYGGAICSLPSDISIAYDASCFVMPQKNDYKNITLHFIDNMTSKQIGNDIFVSSLTSCCNFCQNRLYKYVSLMHIFSIQCIGNYTFTNTGVNGSSIATSPSLLNTSSSCLELIPGLPHELIITQIDELGNASDLFHVTAKTEDFSGLVKYAHVSTKKGSITVYGKIRTNGTIVLENNAPVVSRKKLNFSLSRCPPGFSLDYEKACTCSATKEDDRYFQMPSCNNVSALITHGFWVGYIGNSPSESTLFTGACVADFCSYNGTLPKNGYNEIPISIKTRKKLEKTVCGENRTGILCSSCIEGYSAYYHSPSFMCANTSTAHCAYGIPLYIVSELLPVTIIFTVILVFNISLTSGGLNSFVFYAQILDFLYIDAFRTLFETTGAIRTIHTIYASFNLKLFHSEKLSFCLISDVNSVDMYMFEYATILYAVMLVIATVLVLRLHSCYCCVKLGNRCGRRNIRGSIVDGLSAFLVLCYFKCSLITFSILTPVTLRGRGKSRNRTVSLLIGDTEYFGSGHLPYAIPAVLCLIVVMLPPPCILLLEPVATKFLSLQIWPKSVKYFYNKLRFKFMPFLDSFQASFKDQHRYVAGLYFAYRVVIPLLYLVFRETVSTCYIAVEVLLFLLVFLHITIQPYKMRWHNLLESAFLINLLFVNTITIFNYAATIWGDSESQNEVITAVWIQVLTVILPLVYLVVYTLVSLYQKIKQFKNGYQRLDTNADAAHTDSMGFPARLIDL